MNRLFVSLVLAVSVSHVVLCTADDRAGMPPSMTSFVLAHTPHELLTITTDVPTTIEVEYGIDPEQRTRRISGKELAATHTLTSREPLLEGATYFYRFTITDAFGRSTTSDTLAASISTPDNRAPRIRPIAPVTIRAGDAVALPIFVEDDAKTALPTLLVDHLPAWMMLEPSRVRTLTTRDMSGDATLHVWTDEATPSGVYRVLLTAMDDQNAFDQTLATIVVRRPTDAPRILSVEWGQTTAESLDLRVVTDSPATAEVAFGTGDLLQRRESLTTSPRCLHFATLTGLTRATEYHALITVRNETRSFRRAVKGATLTKPTTVISLDANTPTPFLLDQPGAVYRLMSDIVARKTAFVVGANDVTLDLQGHTITYAAGPPELPVVVNPSFEEPLPRGWDTRAAPNAFRDTNAIRVPQKKNEATCASGDASLGWKLPLARGDEFIVSDPIRLTGGYTYSISMRVYDWISGWREGDPIARVGIELVDAATLAPLPVQSHSTDATTHAVVIESRKATELGVFFFGEVFHLARDATVRLRLTLKPTDPKLAGLIHVDDVAIVVANYYGVVIATHWADPLYPDVPLVKSPVARFHLHNGRVMQDVRAAAFNGDAIILKTSARSLSCVERIESVVGGVNSQNLCAGGGDHIHHNTFEDRANMVSNRHHQEGGNLHLKKNTGRNLVEFNTITGGAQYGINIGGEGCENEIAENTIANDTKVTQGYNIGVSGNGTFIHHNTIRTSNGNGVMVSDWNNTLADNTIEISARANQEYGFWNGCKAVELRAAGNTLITRNQIKALIPGEEWVDAHALTFRQSLPGNRVMGNVLVAESHTPNRRGAAMRFYHDASHNALLRDNHFIGNTLLISAEEGYSAGATFWRNRWTYQPIPSAAESGFAAVTAGWYGNAPDAPGMQLGRFFDNTEVGVGAHSQAETNSGGGGERDLVWDRATISSNAATFAALEKGRAVAVRVVDTQQRPVAHAQVIVTDATETPVVTGMTTTDGFLRVMASRDTIYHDGEARWFLFFPTQRSRWNTSGMTQRPQSEPLAPPTLTITCDGWKTRPLVLTSDEPVQVVVMEEATR